MSDPQVLAPARVTIADARRQIETDDGGFENGVMIDAAREGSQLLLGLAWIRSGTEASSWTADAQTHETYYVLQGRLEVSWGGEYGGAEVLEPSDCFYFPPGRSYTVQNVGEDKVRLVWHLSPSPASFFRGEAPENGTGKP